MATKRFPNDRITCEVLPQAVIFKHESKAVANGEEVWQENSRFEIDCAAVSDKLENGDSFASMKAYGIRAFLLDRTSQFREFGPAVCMQRIQEHFSETLAVGVYKAKRAASVKAGSLDPLLAQAVAELKGLPVEQALASLKALTPDQRKQIASNARIAERMAALRQETAEADIVDLGDLL
jgi:hypothetical protein